MAGDQMKMREALVELTDKVLDYLHKGLIQLPLPLEDATAKARAALSAPARNCDVGTADEQDARFLGFCRNQVRCEKCELYKRGGGLRHCRLRWAQMPYKAEEGGAR